MPRWEDKGIDDEGFRIWELNGHGRFVVQVTSQPGDELGTFVTISEKVSPWADADAIDYGKQVAEQALTKLQMQKR